MLKKILVVLLTLVLVAWAGITWFVGKKTEEALRAELEKLAADPKLGLTVVYKRGFFSSTADLKFDSDEVEFVGDETVEMKIYHGPIAFTPDGVKLCADYLVATHGEARSDFETEGEDDTVVPGFLALGDGRLAVQVKLDRTLEVAYQNPKVEVTTNGEAYEIRDLGLSFAGTATDGVLSGSKKFSFSSVQLPPYDELAEAQAILANSGEFAIEVGGLDIKAFQRWLEVHIEKNEAMKNNEVQRVYDELDPLWQLRFVQLFGSGFRLNIEAGISTSTFDFDLEYVGSGRLVDTRSGLEIAESLQGALDLNLDKSVTDLSPSLTETLTEYVESENEYVVETDDAFVSSIRIGDGQWTQNGRSQSLRDWLGFWADAPFDWSQIDK